MSFWEDEALTVVTGRGEVDVQPDEIQVELKGRHGQIDPRAVAEAITALDKILRSLSNDSGVPITLSALSIGSANIGIRTSEWSVTTLREGMVNLSEVPTVPVGWSIDTVAGLLDLEQVRKRAGVEEIGLRITDTVQFIDQLLTDNAKASIAPPRPSLGSVRGELYRYNGQRRIAALRDYRTLRAVEVRFPSALAEAVRGALDREVEAQGVVTRDLHDQVKSIDLTELEVVVVSKEKTTLESVIGLFGPEWTDGLDSVEWVRRQRD